MEKVFPGQGAPARGALQEKHLLLRLLPGKWSLIIPTPGSVASLSLCWAFSRLQQILGCSPSLCSVRLSIPVASGQTWP